ncbi:MAG: GFA family protein [Rhodospirillales bacterium]
MTKTLHARCKCGAVQIETTAPSSVFHCHCESCRRSTGQPAVTFASFTGEQVTFSGTERKVYDSSPGVERTFCPDCGTPIAWEGDGDDGVRLIEMYVGLFEERDELVPQYHILYEERVPWYDVADGLPRYNGMSPTGTPAAHGPKKDGLPK